MSEQRVSHYRVLKYLGGGAMGKVFLAEDTQLRRKVALKFLPAELTDDEPTLRRFKTEARATAKLDHPNICNIHEIAQGEDGAWFIAMAYYEGRTLKHLLAEGPLPVDKALDYARQIALGLSRAHNEGVVHRDIKPANIMVTDRGEVKIVDFGLARLSGRTHLTRTGTVMGTAAYMSPEQARGEEASFRSDIWSAGVVTYEMLSGQLPFNGDNEVAMIYSILNRDPLPLPGPGCRADKLCGRIIARCLAKDPRKRYPRARVLADDLQVALSGDKDAPSSRPSRPSVYVKPHRLRRLAGGGAVAALLLVALSFLPAVRDSLPPVLPWMHRPIGVAVMPFVLEGTEDAAALGLGLSWYVTDRLTRREDFSDRIWTVPFDDLRDASPATREIAARRLGVQRVVTGKGTFDGGRIALELSVFNPRSGTSRTREFDESYGNLGTWQDGLVEWIVSEASPRAAAEDLRIPVAANTAVPDAFLAFGLGRGQLALAASDIDRHREHLDQALMAFNRAVAQDSAYASAWAGLGEAVWDAFKDQPPDSIAAADSCLKRAARLDPGLVWAPILLSQWHLAEGDTTAAVAAALHAAALRPGCLEAHYNLADLYESLGRDADAVAAHRAATDSKPRYPRVHRRAGLHHYVRKERELALPYWREVLDLTPDDCAGYSLMGALMFDAGRWDAAREYFLEANAIEPHSAFCSNLATTFYYEGRYLDAVDMYRRACRLYQDENPGHQPGYDLLGRMAEAFRWAPGYEDSARIYYRRALEVLEPQLAIDPDDPGLLADRASFTANLGARDEALETLEALDGRRGLQAYQMFTMATVYEQLGHREQALQWLETALENGQSLKVVEVYPVLRHLRATERYQALKKKYVPS